MDRQLCNKRLCGSLKCQDLGGGWGGGSDLMSSDRTGFPLLSYHDGLDHLSNHIHFQQFSNTSKLLPETCSMQSQGINLPAEILSKLPNTTSSQTSPETKKRRVLLSFFCIYWNHALLLVWTFTTQLQIRFKSWLISQTTGFKPTQTAPPAVMGGRASYSVYTQFPPLVAWEDSCG